MIDPSRAPRIRFALGGEEHNIVPVFSGVGGGYSAGGLHQLSWPSESLLLVSPFSDVTWSKFRMRFGSER